ncbi:unnamed protein product [Parajaminaea phylloscopi]
MRIPWDVLTPTALLIARQSSSAENGSSTEPANATLVPTGPLPSNQSLCTSPIYCPGPILQAVQLAQVYEDSKTFVDKPSLKPEADIVAEFAKLGDGKGGNLTLDQIKAFLETNFGPEGTELVQGELGSEYTPSPSFLQNVTDPVLHDWIAQVHGYWPLLARITNETSASGVQCEGCVSSFIPFKERRTFVVPGGRFRELYYWDTYFVILGLLRSQLNTVVKDLLNNFGDLVETIGFVPNGNRVYYLNRSQPPLLTQMVDIYINATQDDSILVRMLPLLEKEYSFWITNRSIAVKSPYSGVLRNVSHYQVNTSAPRPESYLEDYKTVELAEEEQELSLNSTQRAKLYSDLASGAESGLDFSAVRWSKRPTINLTDTIPAQRFLNTGAQIPVDLNAILYKNAETIARFYARNVSTSNGTLTANATAEKAWQERASQQKQAILDLHWDPERLWFYDFNTTANQQASNWTAAGVWPYWANIVPPAAGTNGTSASANATLSPDDLQRSFSGLRAFFDRYNGSLTTTLVETGQQWDFNSWPPLVQVAIDALRNLPANLTAGQGAVPAPNGSFALLPRNGTLNQYGLEESELVIQNLVGTNTSLWSSDSVVGQTPASNGTNSTTTLVNAGEATANETWSEELTRLLTNRYIASALCSWHATGGTLNLSSSDDPQGLWRKVDNATLEREGATNATGLMFEKFLPTDLSAAGGGGEYTVQTGFGWTNGVALWILAEFPDVVKRPTCPALTDANGQIIATPGAEASDAGATRRRRARSV